MSVADEKKRTVSTEFEQCRSNFCVGASRRQRPFGARQSEPAVIRGTVTSKRTDEAAGTTASAPAVTRDEWARDTIHASGEGSEDRREKAIGMLHELAGYLDQQQDDRADAAGGVQHGAALVKQLTMRSLEISF
jgi:hypothetical protein